MDSHHALQPRATTRAVAAATKTTARPNQPAQTVLVLPPNQANPPQSSPSKGTLPAGAIIGIVVGFVVIILLIIAFSWWRRRRAARREEAQDTSGQWQKQKQDQYQQQNDYQQVHTQQDQYQQPQYQYQQSELQQNQYQQQRDLQRADGSYVGHREQYEDVPNSETVPFLQHPSRPTPAMGNGIPYADRDMEMVDRQRLS